MQQQSIPDNFNLQSEQSNITNRISKIEDDINKINSELENQNSNINQKLERLDEKEKRLDEEIDKIESLRETFENEKEEVEQLKGETEDMLKGTVSSALGEQFQKRKDELENTLRWWKYASFISVISLVLFAIWVYFDITTQPSPTVTLISKAVIILPVSVVVWFTVSNYTRQKKLMHEYEFKKNIALSFPGFREAVDDQLPEDNDEIIAEFVIGTMDKMYSNPQQNISNSDQQADNNGGGNTPLRGGQGSLATLIQNLGK